MISDPVKEEDKRMRRLRIVMDLSHAVLMQADLTLHEAFTVVNDAKKAALALFPGKDAAFDLIYRPRFLRVIRERFVIPGGKSS